MRIVSSLLAMMFAIQVQAASNFIEFADKDGNNMIDEDEMIAYHREIEEKHNVSEAERMTDESLRGEVMRHDKNKNGFIDNEDFQMIQKEVDQRKSAE